MAKSGLLFFTYKRKKYAFAGRNVVYVGKAGSITTVTDEALKQEMAAFFIAKSKTNKK